MSLYSREEEKEPCPCADVRTIIACVRACQLVNENYETEESVDELVKDIYAHIDHVHLQARNEIWGTSVMISVSDTLNYIMVAFGNKNNTYDHEKTRPEFNLVSFGEKDSHFPSSLLKVYDFFNESYFEVGLHHSIEEYVEILTGIYPKKNLIFTGHHAGAASAVICSLSVMMSSPHLNASVITFGCPRIGNDNFQAFTDDISNLNIWRYIYENDYVTQIPSSAYCHVGYLITLSDFDGAKLYNPGNDYETKKKDNVFQSLDKNYRCESIYEFSQNIHFNLQLICTLFYSPFCIRIHKSIK